MRLSSQDSNVPFFGAQEVFAIRKEHVFDAGLQNNGTHWALLTGAIPSPTAIGANQDGMIMSQLISYARRDACSRVGQEDVNAVLSVLFILPLGFENKLLQDIIVSRNNAKRRCISGVVPITTDEST